MLLSPTTTARVVRRRLRLQTRLVPGLSLLTHSDQEWSNQKITRDEESRVDEFVPREGDFVAHTGQE